MSLMAILDWESLKEAIFLERISWLLRKKDQQWVRRKAGRVDRLSGTVQLTKVQWFQL